VATGQFTGTMGGQFLARASDGTLYLYVGDGHGGFLGRRVVGHGWQVYSAVIGVGSWIVGGGRDVLALDHDGNVRLYLGEGVGILFAGSGIIGRHWDGYRLAS